MTDKHIPASKLFELPKFSDPITGQPAIFHADLRALIDEAPEVDQPIGVHAWECEGCGSVTRSPERYQELLRKAGHVSCCPDSKYKMLTLFPVTAPSPDLTKLVGEVLEALENLNNSVTSCIDLTPELLRENSALLTRAKEYLK